MQYKVPEADYIHGGVQKDHYALEDVDTWACPLCGSSKYIQLYKERGNLGIAECTNCQLVYTNPRSKDAEANYFGDATIFLEEARLIFEGKKSHHRDKNYDFELNEIRKFKPSGKFLDIGTNMGFFLNKAKEHGYDTQGVEPAPALASIASEKFGLNINNGYFNKEDFSPASFDIITMIDVFEHVTTPVDLLSNAYEVLKDDGILCIKVPNGNYNKLKLKLARIFNKEGKHDIFNGYEHVVHYTPKSMKEMLEKANFRIRKLILPLPIHPPIWANLVGHYYQYSSPYILDWKRIITRKIFYRIGTIEKLFGLKINLRTGPYVHY